MSIIQLYEDFNIPYAPEGHQHYRQEWINTECCYCTGNPGFHLGYNLDGNYYYCWRCGWQLTIKTISKLIGTTKKETEQILKKYKIGKSRISKEPKVQIRAKAHKFPSGTGLLTDRHKRYLEKRGFAPDQLIREWELIATGPIAMLDNVNYKHRIIAPIFWNGVHVTFQGRDITDKSSKKYLACPESRELVHHKDILYGKQTAWNGIGICVEGITDVWRFGINAFATFGIEYTNAQIRVMAKWFKRIAVVFDDEPQAAKQAEKLVADLRFRGVDAWQVDIEGDPGAMKQDDADYLVKTIMK